MPPTLDKKGKFLPFGIEPLENECEEVVNGNDRAGGTFCCKPMVGTVARGNGDTLRVCKLHKKMYDRRAERNKQYVHKRSVEEKLHEDTERRARVISKLLGVPIRVHYHIGFGKDKSHYTSRVEIEIADLEKIANGHPTTRT